MHVDDDYLLCHQCGSTDHVVDRTSWDRICRDCGATSAPEIELDEIYDTKVYRNSRVNHYRNTMGKIKWNNLTNVDYEHLEIVFNEWVDIFMETRHIHGRKNMINYHFLFYKILEQRGEENIVEKYKLRMPVLQKTLDKLEETLSLIHI